MPLFFANLNSAEVASPCVSSRVIIGLSTVALIMVRLPPLNVASAADTSPVIVTAPTNADVPSTLKLLSPRASVPPTCKPPAICTSVPAGVISKSPGEVMSLPVISKSPSISRLPVAPSKVSLVTIVPAIASSHFIIRVLAPVSLIISHLSSASAPASPNNESVASPSAALPLFT